MTPQDPTEHFIRSLTESQNRLYAYIYSLTGNHDRAADVLQECNLVLWRKHGEFRSGGDFIAWAFGIARFQVLAHLRDAKRDRSKLLPDDLIELLHPEAEQQAVEFDELCGALRHCLDKLPPNSRDMIDRRYFRKLAVTAIADEMKRGLSAVKVGLLRARQALRRCIDQRMAQAGTA